MGVARPVRFLGALSVGLFIFLIYLFMKPPTTIATSRPKGGQNGERIADMDRDPLLDSESTKTAKH